MDLADLPAYLERLKKAAGDAAVPAANAMGELVRWQVANVALKQVAHGPGMFYRAVPMRSPAYASGFLSRSITLRPASGGVAIATVFSTAEYAAIQEEGGDTWPSHNKYMKWENSGGTFYRKLVRLPPHPYFTPTVDRLIRNGDLTIAARQAFWVRVRPFFGG